MDGGPQQLRNVSMERRRSRQSELAPPTRRPLPAPPELSSRLPIDSTHRSGDDIQVVEREILSQGQLIKENAALKEDVSFLRDYVAKCEGQLRLYQLKLPDMDISPDIADVLGADYELPPWSTSSKYMSPLLVAYEKRVRDLEEGNALKVKELKILKEEAERLINRNQEVELELENSYSKLLRQMDNQMPGLASDADLLDLQERIKLYQEERAILHAEEESRETTIKELQDKLQGQMGRIHELEKQCIQSQADLDASNKDVRILEGEKRTLLESIPKQKEELMKQLLSQKEASLSELEDTKKRLHEEHKRERDAISKELEGTKQQLAEVVQERKISQARAAEEIERLSALAEKTQSELCQKEEVHAIQCRQHVDIISQLKLQVKTLQEQAQAHLSSNEEQRSRIEVLEQVVSDSEKQLADLQKQHNVAQRDLEGMVISLENMERTVETYKAREIGMLRREGECQEREQQEIVKRQQAEAQMEVLGEEVKRLKTLLKDQIDEIKRTAMSDQEGLFARTKEKEHALLEEIKGLELACSELQVKREQAERERASLQERFDKLTETAQKLQMDFAEQLQRVKEELAMVRASQGGVEATSSRAVSKQSERVEELTKERDFLSSQLAEVQAQTNRQKHELAEQARAREIMREEMRELNHHLRISREKQELMAAQHGSQLDEAKHSKVQAVSELENRLKVAIALHEQTESRSLMLLRAQEELANKYREESRDSAQHLQVLLAKVEAQTPRNLKTEILLKQVVRERDAALEVARKSEDGKLELTARLALASKDLNAASAKLIHYERLRKENKDMKLQLERHTDVKIHAAYSPIADNNRLEVSRNRLQRQVSRLEQLEQTPLSSPLGDLDSEDSVGEVDGDYGGYFEPQVAAQLVVH